MTFPPGWIAFILGNVIGRPDGAASRAGGPRPGGKIEAGGVDLAGAVHGGGRRRAVARQDAQAWQAPAAAQHRSAGSRFGLGAAAGREHPLDGPGTCQGGRSEPAFGATHPGSSPTRAAPYPDVQTVEGPEFVEKHIVGLYVDPPAHAVVLSVDEKSQIQALDRTQPGLPMKKGRAGTMTH